MKTRAIAARRGYLLAELVIAVTLGLSTLLILVGILSTVRTVDERVSRENRLVDRLLTLRSDIRDTAARADSVTLKEPEEKGASFALTFAWKGGAATYQGTNEVISRVSTEGGRTLREVFPLSPDYVLTWRIQRREQVALLECQARSLSDRRKGDSTAEQPIAAEFCLALTQGAARQ